MLSSELGKRSAPPAAPAAPAAAAGLADDEDDNALESLGTEREDWPTGEAGPFGVGWSKLACLLLSRPLHLGRSGRTGETWYKIFEAFTALAADRCIYYSLWRVASVR